jgi:hypothetical protein
LKVRGERSKDSKVPGEGAKGLFFEDRLRASLCRVGALKDLQDDVLPTQCVPVGKRTWNMKYNLGIPLDAKNVDSE